MVNMFSSCLGEKKCIRGWINIERIERQNPLREEKGSTWGNEKVARALHAHNKFMEAETLNVAAHLYSILLCLSSSPDQKKKVLLSYLFTPLIFVLPTQTLKYCPWPSDCPGDQCLSFLYCSSSPLDKLMNCLIVCILFSGAIF